MKEFRPEISPHPKKVSESVPYRDGVMTCTFDITAFRQSLISEAKKRPGYDVATTTALAEKLAFFTDYSDFSSHLLTDFYSRGETDHFWRVFRHISKQSLQLSDFLLSNQPAALTYTQLSAPAVYINLESHAAYTGVPSVVPKEVLQLALIQNLNSTLLHEREHLLRLTNPQTRQIDYRTKLAQAATVGITSGSITLGSLLLMPKNPIGDPRLDVINATWLALTPLLALKGAHLVSTLLWFHLFNPAEKAARAQEKANFYPPNLVDIHFESISNY